MGGASHLNEWPERSDSKPGGEFGPIGNGARLQQELRPSEVTGLIQNPPVNQHTHTHSEGGVLDLKHCASVSMLTLRLFGVCGQFRLNIRPQMLFHGKNSPIVGMFVFGSLTSTS